MSEKAVLAKLRKHSDLIVLLMVIVGLIAGGFYAYLEWQVSQSGWRTNFQLYSVDPSQMIDSGMGRDGIHPIDTPRFDTVAIAGRWLDARSPVIVVNLNGQVRAYPLVVLLRHEIVNDVIADMAIAVTFCPLCNSPIVYNRTLDGVALRMGVSGNLYNNGFLMWDDRTESWWQQFTGEALVGDYTGRKLAVIASQLVGFSTFANRYPQGMVLVGDATRPDLSYTMNPYMGYDNGTSPMMSGIQYDTRLMPMDRVLAGIIGDTPIAYDFSQLSVRGVINDVVNGEPLVAFWMQGAASALNSPTIAQSRDVGQAALFHRRLADGTVLTFYNQDGVILDEQTDSQWNIFGEAIVGTLSGVALEKITCYANFWFAWSSAYPETLLYQDH